MTSSPLTDHAYNVHDDDNHDRVDRLLRLSAKFERALRKIAELDYTRAAVNCCATTARQIATDALSNTPVCHAETQPQPKPRTP